MGEIECAFCNQPATPGAQFPLCTSCLSRLRKGEIDLLGRETDKLKSFRIPLQIQPGKKLDTEEAE